ncbi:MAG: DNA adenine methylase [Acidobacteriota bacterium]
MILFADPLPAAELQPHRGAWRHHGGKAQLAQRLVGMFPPHRQYREPYCGSAAVLLAKPRVPNELLVDLDDLVVKTLRCIRDRTAELARVCALTPFARAENELPLDEDLEELELARRFLLQASAGIGSYRKKKNSFRRWRSNEGSAPATVWRGVPQHIRAVGQRLLGVTIESRPALEVIAATDARDALFYVDPPYPHATRGQGGRGFFPSDGYQHEMTDDDHEELLDLLLALTGLAIVSSYPNAIYADRLGGAGWARYEMAAYAERAERRTEVLWINPAAQAAQMQGSLFQ